MNHDALIKFWSSQGVSIAGGVTEEEIQRFESKYQLQICREFRVYLADVNGMLETDSCDSNMFCFWPLSKLKSVAEECPNLKGTKGHENYFVFADYMIWSWHTQSIWIAVSLTQVRLFSLVAIDSSVLQNRLKNSSTCT